MNFIWYKDSPFASAVSLIGCALVFIRAFPFMEQHSIPLGVIGLVLIILGKIIDVVRQADEKEETEAARQAAKKKAAETAGKPQRYMTAQQQQNEYIAERSSLEKQLTQDPNNSAIHARLGWLYRRTGVADLALVHLRRAIELGTDGDMQPYYELSDMHQVRKEYADGARVSRAALELCDNSHKNYSDFVTRYCVCAARSGNAEETERALEYAQNNGQINLVEPVREMLSHASDPDQTAQTEQSAGSMHPAAAMALAAEQRRLEEAVKLRPDSADLHTKLGVVYIQGDKKELARQTLEKAIDLGAAGDMLAYLRLGEIYITEKRFDSAAEVLRRGLDGCTPETPTRRAILVTYAAAAGMSGDTESARKCFDEAESLGYAEATPLRQRLGF